uniref:Uncharacterized protein n=1 Tax=Noctiluca scintillans TaxID=2966 RepID=A0A7S1FIU0_NOCSC
MIENSGQCTALRHALVPGASEADLKAAFENSPTVTSPVDALREGAFAGVFTGTDVEAPFRATPGYTLHDAPGINIAYRANEALPADGIDEMWRQTYVDLTTPQGDLSDSVDGLSRWLVRNQPISLAVNTVGGDLTHARKLFEQTGQVVYTIGYEGNPALTVQARPQEGEVFGEFPVRRDLGKYTRYPVVVPSPTPAYNSTYEPSFLEEAARRAPPASLAYASTLLDLMKSPHSKGYCVLVMEYLADAVGVHRGDGSQTGGPNRTILFGLQRPPLGQQTFLRCGSSTTLDELAPTLIPFYVTNARDGLLVSVDSANASLLAHLRALNVLTVSEDAASFDTRCTSEEPYNVVPPEALADRNNHPDDLETFPLVGQFVSLYVPLGHVKSTQSDDQKFVEFFSASAKWLRLQNA